ncbi:MAG: SDR family oxidoreductase [Spirochaetaceae bacterium]|nr:MAG: SDR family oxidoreductase [Spirochaetaceae bacterium]
MNLKNTHVLITGGGSGIGLGVALALAEGGAQVLLCGRRKDVLDEVVSANPGLSLRARTLDLTDRQAVDALFEELEREDRSPEIVVNSAGINISQRSMATMDPAEWDQVISVNLTGAYNVMHAALPSMRKRQSGLIVNISSVAGKRALPMAGVAYAASKFGVTALGTSVGLEEAKNGIRVSNIYPGEVATPLLDKRIEPVPQERRVRMVQPEDIGRIVRLMAELPASAHIPEIIIKPLYQEYM